MNQRRHRRKQTPIVVKKALKNAKKSMKEAGVRQTARLQLILYSTLYIAAVLIAALLVAYALNWVIVAVISRSYFWYIALLLLGIWAGVTFLYYGYFIVETNDIWFVRVMGGVYKPISQGRTNFLPPIQDIHPQYLSLQRQVIAVDQELELREVLDGHNETKLMDPILRRKIGPHEKTTITTRLEVEYQIFDPYLFAFVMGGNTKEAKQETISGLINDPLQTFVNSRGYGEDELVALSGYRVWRGGRIRVRDRNGRIETRKATGIKDIRATGSGKRLEKAVLEYGLKILRVTIKGTELDDVRKKARTDTYLGRMRGQAKALEVEETVEGVFVKKLEKMSPEELREARTYYVTLQAVQAMQQNSKYVVGVSAIINEINAMLSRKV